MMNLNQTERRLRSWRPRNPSPAVERRLFGPAAAAARVSALALPRWLAPAALTLALVVMAYNPRDGAGFSAELAMAATANQSVGAYLAASDHSRLNASTPRFEWTNQRPSISSIRSFPLSGTNLFRR